ncbi:MAG: tryptophan-rich sensory protein [Candidatus Shapirobacteria bacterium]|nr:tryptophan-rich sensory protein [Candidatus Shapirobacteria bacterium]MDD3002438.1 tryptophan-rich sensory protein [Candidatus Shapirobacteria bacterium]MDD4383453.1 tryptophan-rich sensory protein [Candidatus Shapirobacteria bacterium]
MKQKIKARFNLSKFVFCILITEGAGVIGSIATFSSVKTWYLTDLIKPSFNPPSWIFGPVWTLLFFLIGTALYLVWTKKNNLFWFWVQLFLNILWSFLFFGLHSPLFALFEIVLLWFAILITIIKFWSFNKNAGILLLPYLAWVSFASFLNFSIARLN